MEDDNKAEPVIQIPDNQDWVLATIVSDAQTLGFEQAMTLQVNGLIVSGVMIGGAKYFELQTALVEPFATDEMKVAYYMKEVFATAADLYKPEEEDEAPSMPTYIHLRNAQFFSPGQRPLPGEGVLWRGRLSSVDGFSFGSLSVADD
ncbi:gas vesicle accessory protein GvpU [Novosphingobium resinovorum]|uniref:gas vesicle accessory protein GvpU n=1 Tax=Novosphingobium resinovorum TaxID=158500 RepID=UPI002ED2A88D|nr:gas vesicle accessory protein GvpU [Novosphingobium resinovorum]